MADLLVKVNGREYPLDVEQTLADLTGKETLMLEEYLGGWGNFDSRSVRGAVVTVWLAARQAGEVMSLEDVEEMKGLVFGDVIQEVNGGPPDEAASAATPSTELHSVNTSGHGESRSDST